MGVIIDIRKFHRSTDGGVVAQVDNEIVDVIEMSAAGVRLARPLTWYNRRHVEFRFIPRNDLGLDHHRAIPVCGHIVGDGPDHLRIAFSSVTEALANVIGSYGGAQGHSPYPSLAAHHLFDRTGQLLQ